MSDDKNGNGKDDALRKIQRRIENKARQEEARALAREARARKLIRNRTQKKTDPKKKDGK